MCVLPIQAEVMCTKKENDVALGLRVINYVWRHRDLERACVRGIHVYVVDVI